MLSLIITNNLKTNYFWQEQNTPQSLQISREQLLRTLSTVKNTIVMHAVASSVPLRPKCTRSPNRATGNKNPLSAMNSPTRNSGAKPVTSPPKHSIRKKATNTGNNASKHNYMPHEAQNPILSQHSILRPNAANVMHALTPLYVPLFATNSSKMTKN